MAVTLAMVEQEVARRAGPFEEHVGDGNGSTTSATAATLRTSAADGGTYVGQWLQRRVAATGADRARRIVAYDPAAGRLTVDRAYTNAPALNEPFEVSPLDPVRHLRRAVVAGLGRCFFVDRVDVPVTAGRVEQSLSAALFWVVDVGQVRDVRARVGAVGVVADAPLDWVRPFSTSGGVSAGVTAAPAGVYVVEALRPHATWVNGADAPNGPTADADVLACPLDYAAAAGHVELWRIARAVLAPVASGPQALAAPRSEAVSTFEALVRGQWWYWDRPDRVRVRDPAGADAARATAEWVSAAHTWRATAEQFTWRGLSALSWREVLGG